MGLQKLIKKSIREVGIKPKRSYPGYNKDRIYEVKTNNPIQYESLIDKLNSLSTSKYHRISTVNKTEYSEIRYEKTQDIWHYALNILVNLNHLRPASMRYKNPSKKEMKEIKFNMKKIKVRVYNP